MVFLGLAEYRGKELKESKKGNKYHSVIFEDIENGQQARFFAPLNNDFDVKVDDLEKGSVYMLRCSRHYDYGEFKFDLFNVSPLNKEISILYGLSDGK